MHHRVHIHDLDGVLIADNGDKGCELTILGFYPWDGQIEWLPRFDAL